MSSNEVAAQPAGGGFEGLDASQLEARRKSVAADWTALYQGLTGQENGDTAVAMPVLSAEDQSKADDLRATYDNIVALQAASPLQSRSLLRCRNRTGRRTSTRGCGAKRWTRRCGVMRSPIGT